MRQAWLVKRAWIFVAAMFCAGCEPTNTLELIPIRGEVGYRGKPLGEGQVIYLPAQAGNGRQATAQIQPDGTFQMTTRDANDGVAKGDYRIAIFAYAPHPGEPQTREEHEAIAQSGGLRRDYLIPARYADGSTSGLEDTVDEHHSGFKRIELVD